MGKFPALIQVSAPGTGSTLLVNILYGLFESNKSIYHTRFGVQRYQRVALVKSHECNLDVWNNRLKNKYDLYFITSIRNEHGKIDDKYIKPENKILWIDYKDLLEREDYSVEEIVKCVYHKLYDFLPENIAMLMNIQAAVDRVNKMNARYEQIKDRPFKFYDRFYHIHGHHRGRPKKKKVTF